MTSERHARGLTSTVSALAVALVLTAVVWSGSAPAPRGTSGPVTSTAAHSGCGKASHVFAPSSISIPGVTAASRVVAPPRGAHHVPGTPPLSDAGKNMFAWDRAQGTKPGGRKGNVLLNAHTWPDGSALGNRMLRGLRAGSLIVVSGGGTRLCYRVTKRVQVNASSKVPGYYAKGGSPKLAILTCSGRRLGPGHWTKRTIWYARPSA
jgi:hypothetical protein